MTESEGENTSADSVECLGRGVYHFKRRARKELGIEADDPSSDGMRSDDPRWAQMTPTESIGTSESSLESIGNGRY